MKRLLAYFKPHNVGYDSVATVLASLSSWENFAARSSSVMRSMIISTAGHAPYIETTTWRMRRVLFLTMTLI